MFLLILLAGIRLFTHPSTVLGDNGDLVFHSVPPGHCCGSEGRRKWTDWSGRIELSMWTHRLGSKSKVHLVEVQGLHMPFCFIVLPYESRKGRRKN